MGAGVWALDLRAGSPTCSWVPLGRTPDRTSPCLDFLRQGSSLLGVLR